MWGDSEKWKTFWKIYILGLISFTLGLDSRLYKAQGDHLFQNSLQSSEYDIRLEDFFWTGSGDGPPSYKKSVIDKNNGRDTIIKTSTVVATVYIDGNMNMKDLESDPLCLHDCTESNTYASGYLPSDRRYWLLTVLAGYFSQEDYPIIEDKLSKLYRLAFTRQQSWHLGISHNNFGNHTDTRKKRLTTMNVSMYSHQIFQDQIENAKKSGTATNQQMKSRRFNKREVMNATMDSKDTYIIAPSARRKHGSNDRDSRRISVVVHNITSLVSDDTRTADGGDYSATTNRNQSIGNQTEIIYSVFVDRKPVLAKTAADDMKLVTEDEVAQVMEKLVFIKAEPYLREPQATPLAPATGGSQNSNLIAVIGDNPAVLIVGIVATVLLIVLLVGLLLMTRAKRKRSAEVKRLTASRSFRNESSSHLEVIEKVDNEIGIENVAFVNDADNFGKKETDSLNVQQKKTENPILHFPHPPLSSPSSSTSDSSIFYPKRRSRLDVQNILDEKPVTHFDSKNAEAPIYATVAKKKEGRKKMKRKYLSENKVGSMDERHTNSSHSSAYSEVFDGSEKGNNLLERDAKRPLQQYNKNKILQDNKFSVRSPDDELESPTEAFNKEILRALQRGRSPGDSISIGSYLSMASVRSFPKCTVPEPLSRVLEPVSMTHLDHSEIEGSDTGGIPRIVDAQYKIGHNGNENDRNMEADGGLSRSQSDGADPGVLNWGVHKKIMESQEVMSPLRDPALTRTRFEGLLEGAIKLYSNDDTRNDNGNNDVPGAIRPIENKSKSAMDMYRSRGVLSRSISEHKCNRPFTAVPSKPIHENRTTPPSPYNKKAWGSSAPSPLIRPLSAGPFHNPESPSVDVVRVLAPQSSSMLSTAPLIQAIQNELKKFHK
ncbi:hypothetical protein Bhyg_10995 [Pseudolycoriella hygida]|uniref:Uncharacterized protein n=1 Tax=Pseudolycoriella hygida TaxID=35572 RepID=A0A9Q0MUG3_9DIPT|nr:hypothetical protein Bhyg_10995 [Pseudolycoriella hygida]